MCPHIGPENPPSLYGGKEEKKKRGCEGRKEEQEEVSVSLVNTFSLPTLKRGSRLVSSVYLEVSQASQDSVTLRLAITFFVIVNLKIHLTQLKKCSFLKVIRWENC